MVISVLEKNKEPRMHGEDWISSFKKTNFGVPTVVQCLKKPSAGCSGSRHSRSAGWIPGVVQWLKDPVLVHLWLPFKLPCAVGMAITLKIFVFLREISSEVSVIWSH